jgi:hypothetical protein
MAMNFDLGELTDEALAERLMDFDGVPLMKEAAQRVQTLGRRANVFERQYRQALQDFTDMKRDWSYGNRRIEQLRGALADAWQRFRGAGDITGAYRIESVMPDIRSMPQQHPDQTSPMTVGPEAFLEDPQSLDDVHAEMLEALKLSLEWLEIDPVAEYRGVVDTVRAAIDRATASRA